MITNEQVCKRCHDAADVVVLPNGVPFCADCDLPGSMVLTAYGWYLDQGAEVPADKWSWNDRGNGPELIYPDDGVYGPFDAKNEEWAEAAARDWLLRLDAIDEAD